jgi:phospholipid/cholesterol/gamma-HCH transport system substrate-binding protein
MKDLPDISDPPSPDEGERRPENRFRFRRVNEITGTFVLVVIAVLIASVIWTGRSQRWFKSNVSLRISLPEAGAAGIRQGSEVYFLGTRVGSVADVDVDDNGRMEARVGIRRDFFRFVRADSSALVKKKFGVAGDSFFEITRGTGQPLPEENAAIICKEQFQSALESAIEEIRGEALVVLKKTSAGLDTWTKLGADLRETRQRLDQVTVHLENLASGVEQGKGTIGKLLTDPALADDSQKLVARLDTLAASLQQGKGTLGRLIIDGNLADQTELLLTRANGTMNELQAMTTNLEAAVKNVRGGTEHLPEISELVAGEARNLPGLVLQTQVSMRELERLIEAMQRQWLVRKLVNHTNPPPMRILPAAEPPKTDPLPPRKAR